MGGLLVGCSVRSCGRERRTADTVAARAGGRSVAVASPASEEQRGPVMVTYRLYTTHSSQSYHYAMLRHEAKALHRNSRPSPETYYSGCFWLIINLDYQSLFIEFPLRALHTDRR